MTTELGAGQSAGDIHAVADLAPLCRHPLTGMYETPA
jgi:hypothetical protein